MRIIIVSATKMEISHLLKVVDVVADKKELVSCTYQSHSIDFLITGIGMVSTTYQLTKAFRNKYDFALNIGICGGFNKNFDLGDVVHIIQDELSELGAENDKSFLSLNDLNLKGKTLFTDTLSFKNKVLDAIPKVTGITVNTVHGNEESIDQVFDRCHPYTESMEGAAFMYVCEEENIPFAQIRSVSNYVEKRNKDTWNIPLAIKNSNQKVLEILTSL